MFKQIVENHGHVDRMPTEKMSQTEEHEAISCSLHHKAMLRADPSIVEVM